ncbi:hypothetical protein JCGZ_03484 [Jatropha curcas]|uniref:PGG domain-containing protein n=1 Tax=Jatropha curcas TaxID=180498 RepID=A0A067KY89_JATCU|nr:hypothetical protein JCGZ_03484 [Jatropha curcas]
MLMRPCHSLSDHRKGVLTFSTLMAVGCFLLGVNPPGGVWQYDHKFISSSISHIPGTAMLVANYQKATKPTGNQVKDEEIAMLIWKNK